MNGEIKEGQSKISLPNLVETAKRGLWELVDKAIPTICDDEKFVNWSIKNGLDDQNSDIRDLAVSILEKSKHELNSDETVKLQKLMETDVNFYVQFRSAFALFNHGIKTLAIVEKLQLALKNKDVRGIARGYLKKLG